MLELAVLLVLSQCTCHVVAFLWVSVSGSVLFLPMVEPILSPSNIDLQVMHVLVVGASLSCCVIICW